VVNYPQGQFWNIAVSGYGIGFVTQPQGYLNGSGTSQTVTATFTATYANSPYVSAIDVSGLSSLNGPTITVTAPPPPYVPPPSYNEIVSGPSQVYVNQSFNINLSGGAPYAVVQYSGAASGSNSLDGSGNGVFAGVSFSSAGTYNYTFVFGVTADVRTYSVRAINLPPPPYVPPAPTVTASGAPAPNTTMYTGTSYFYDTAVTSTNATSGTWSDNAGHSGAVNFYNGSSTGFDFVISSSQAAGSYTISITVTGPGGSASTSIGYSLAPASAPTLVFYQVSPTSIASASGGTITAYYQTTGSPTGGFYNCSGGGTLIVNTTGFTPSNPFGSLSVYVPPGSPAGTYTVSAATYNTQGGPAGTITFTVS
jgi:hypothetical protein